MNENYNTNSYQKAKHRVEQLKSFYTHLAVYLLVNLSISGLKIYFSLDEGNSLYDAIINVNNLSVWLVWGVFILIHASRTFLLPWLVGYDWEARKIQRYVEEERHNDKNFLDKPDGKF